ncbi:MAG: sugar transferase [Anaerolineales bacterium]
MSEVIISNDQNANWLYVFARNAVDYAFALFVLLIFWWALLAVWAAVRLNSPGPGIFRQLRVGRNQTIFTCYKFRTMDVSTPSLGTHEVSASMVTPLGAWLRKTKLDELPQIVNILLNQMSLIGPRPCLPVQEALISERRLAGIFEVKPGITGLAQVKGIDMSEPVRLAQMDQQYIRTRGLLLDAKIALATALGNGSGDRVKGSRSPRDPGIRG